jgi:hypothetical protein
MHRFTTEETQTLRLFGHGICSEVFWSYESTGEGANTIASGMQKTITRALGRAGTEAELTHVDLTHWGDRLINAGRAWEKYCRDRDDRRAEAEFVAELAQHGLNKFGGSL